MDDAGVTTARDIAAAGNSVADPVPPPPPHPPRGSGTTLTSGVQGVQGPLAEVWKQKTKRMTSNDYAEY